MVMLRVRVYESSENQRHKLREKPHSRSNGVIPEIVFTFFVNLFKSQIPVKGSNWSSLGFRSWLKENRVLAVLPDYIT